MSTSSKRLTWLKRLKRAAKLRWAPAGPELAVEFLLPERTLDELFPGADQVEVSLMPRLIRQHFWAMPEHEVLVLGALSKLLQPRLIVEFGTFTGGSTLVMAANTAAETRIITVEVPPEFRATHHHGLGVGLPEFDVGSVYRGTSYQAKIEQRFANTLEFDIRGLEAAVNLVLVDADHTYDFVKRDTATAAKLPRPGGAIVWHDYTWDEQSPECAGVTRCVNEFWQDRGRCYRLVGTRFAVFIDRELACSPGH